MASDRDSASISQCECATANINRSRIGFLDEPYICPTCHRVWDGLHWFVSEEWHDVVVAWENLQFEADSVIDGGDERVDEEIDDWAKFLMDFCDENTHMDVGVIWRLVQGLWAELTPFSPEGVAGVQAALAACEPLRQLIYVRAEPGRRAAAERSVTASLDVKHSRKLKAAHREIVEALELAGRRMTGEEICDALARKGTVRSPSTTRGHLSTMKTLGILDHATDDRGQGYGMTT